MFTTPTSQQIEFLIGLGEVFYSDDPMAVLTASFDTSKITPGHVVCWCDRWYVGGTAKRPIRLVCPFAWGKVFYDLSFMSFAVAAHLRYVAALMGDVK